jgi:uncharacterized protein (DUF1499 family)
MRRVPLIRCGLDGFVVVMISWICWFGAISPASALTSPPAQITIAANSLFSFSGQRPPDLGIQNGKLTPCPSSPNCVSSQSLDLDLMHAIAPLTYRSTPDVAFAKLKAVIQSLPRTTIIQATPDYLYVEFSSAILGFVDDVEFYLDKDNAQTIQVRSASRLGESDLGVNRQRIEEIRSQLPELQISAI